MEIAARAAENALRYPPTQGEIQKSRAATDPHVIFARLSRSVRHTLALKARIAAAGKQAQTPADAHNAAILDWLQSEIAAAHHPDPSAEVNRKSAH